MVEFTEATKDNEYILIPKNADVISHRIVIDRIRNFDKQENIFQVFLTKEAVELLKAGEAMICNHYEQHKDNPDQKDKWEKHTKLVNELMEVRNFLNP